MYECDISPSFLRFAGLRSVRKRSKEAKKSFSEVLLKKRFSKLFYPSLVLSVSNHKSAAKANVGFRKTVNMLGRTSSVFFKNKYKVVRLFFNKLRKNLRIASDFDTLIVKNTIEQSVSKFFFSDFINTADTFSSNYNQMNNNVSILGHIHNCNKDKLINNIIKIEHSLYTIINYKYDGFFNLNTITSNKKYNSLKLYNFKLKQLIHSKYNDLGFFFKKNLNINIENNKVYENFFKLVKREEVSLNCRLHQFKFLTNNRNKSVRYKQISPIFLNKVPQYFKKNMHIFRSVSITKGLSIDSANNFNVSF